ncbi:MAG: DUF5808 domain-containing protein [Propionibacteriaceae bacterium]|jgi:hypothetical protein|nr:DUF5808 domain-containing protein [Propionibacteriaceae bacterium]
MTEKYLRAVRVRLGRLSRADRRRALDALSAQLQELADVGGDPVAALGEPATYAARLLDALSHETSADSARWRILGVPVETRGPVNAEVRSRTWDPANPRLFTPRLFGIGWSVNLGAIAVRAGLIRPDDTDDAVLCSIPKRDIRAARAVPLAIAGATAAALALAWRSLPSSVASGFNLAGRPRGEASKWKLLGAVALGAGPALWAQRRGVPVEDRLVRVARATSLSLISAGVVAATVAQARRPRGRWGLLTIASLPVAGAGSLAVVVGPLRSGLRQTWQAASDLRNKGASSQEETP